MTPDLRPRMTCPPKLLALLRDPVGLERLELDGERLVNRTNGRRYSFREGIPVFVDSAALGPQNAKFQRMYDRIAWLYDAGLHLGNLWFRGELIALRRQIGTRLELRPGHHLLYTSVGTGADLPYLAHEVGLESIEWVGVDLSFGMLRRCARRLRKYRETALLVQANAERLPLAGHTFDVALQLGGINFFDQPAAAVAEMVRVAKPGGRIAVIDETKRVVETSYRKNPLIRDDFKDVSDAFDPRSWVPAGMTDLSYEEVLGGRGYILSFRTPA